MAGKNLVIVESPKKCDTIEAFLGSNYIVMASCGHVMEIPQKGINIDIKNGFTPTYEVSKDKKDVVKKIKEAAKNAETIYLASDPDREGSAIAWSIYSLLDEKCKAKCTRIMFNEINKKSVLKAIENGTSIESHANLIDAAKARQVMDRLIGYKVSPTLWYSAHINGASAGRVQSIALKLVCERQKEIDSFKPSDYWFIEALLQCKNGDFWAKVVTKEKDNRYLDEKLASEDLDKIKKSSFVIDKAEKSEKSNSSPPPFDTNSLQVTCSSVFGWSLMKSKTLAQKLYEEGKITYIRTDSFNISDEALDSVRSFIKENYSQEYIPSKPNTYSKKSSASAQEAHECIRPVHIEDEGDDIDENDEKKMYKLIRDRFICCQMTPQIVNTVVYDIKSSSKHDLIAKGQSVKFDGWSKVYKYSKTKEEILPDAKENEKLALIDSKQTKHTTQPPARYNEASLAKIMEKEGVGRPSTRDTIITSIQKKGYVDRDKKSKGLVATTMGMKIYEYLQPSFKDFFMDIKYTASLENELDEITTGEKKYLDVVTEVYDNLQKHIKQLGSVQSDGEKTHKKTGKKCSVCEDGEIVETDGRYGVFYSCSNYPKCKSVFLIDEEGNFSLKKKIEPKKTGKKCPECEKKKKDGELVERSNKKDGSIFLGCTNYPSCRYSESVK